MKKIAALFSILLFTLSCNLFTPGPNELFYCKINGKKFIPETTGPNNLQIIWQESFGGLSIRAKNEPYQIFVIIGFDDKKISEGRFVIDKSNKNCNVYFTPNIRSANTTDLQAYTGFVEITKKDGYLLSGTFEFKAYNASETKEYIITKGEFNNLSYY